MVSRANSQAAYRQIQVETAGKEKLIVMLYNGAIAAIQRAKDLMKVRDFVGTGTAIFKAQDIVMELNLSLNEEGGTVAMNLRRLYAYTYRRLSEANMKTDPLLLEETLRILSTLRHAWVTTVSRATVERHAEQAEMLA